MTLATHAVVGAAVASVLPHDPALAFVGGFLSHFILDAIPHWEYKILSLQKKDNDHMKADMVWGRDFLMDVFRISADAILGFIVGLFLFSDSAAFPYILIVGMIGAILPDFLQFVYFKIKIEPFRSIKRFHDFVHAENDLKDKPIVGILCQVAVIAVSYFLASNIAGGF